jgi:hypothetical protein
MHCFESPDAPLKLLHTKARDSFFAFVCGGLFTGRDEGPCDSIFGMPFGAFDDGNKMEKAKRHIMRHFETSQYLIRLLLGLPYILPSMLPNEAKHIDYIVAALCWRHI